MSIGLTIANVVGGPVATRAGEHLGWRPSFWVVSALGVVSMAALRLMLPALPAPSDSNAMADLRVLTRGPVLGALGLTAVGASAMFTVFTYITPILRDVTHASLGFVTAMLVTYGVGLTIGNWLGGRFADRSVDRTLILTLGSLALILIAFALLMPFKGRTAILIFRWGVASFAFVSPLQVRGWAAAQLPPVWATPPRHWRMPAPRCSVWL